MQQVFFVFLLGEYLYNITIKLVLRHFLLIDFMLVIHHLIKKHWSNYHCVFIPHSSLSCLMYRVVQSFNAESFIWTFAGMNWETEKHQSVFEIVCHQDHYTSLLAQGFVCRAAMDQSPYGLVFSLCARVNKKRIIIHPGFIGSVCVIHDQTAAGCMLTVANLAMTGTTSAKSYWSEMKSKRGSPSSLHDCGSDWNGLETMGKVKAFIPIGWQPALMTHTLTEIVRAVLSFKLLFSAWSLLSCSFWWFVLKLPALTLETPA